jgi:single-stranded DNA-binding protein
MGRLGTEVKFKVTPKGLLVASFPLGIHEDDGRTTWETVLAFGDRAEKLRDTLTRGQQAHVVGYRKERTYTGRDGRERTVREFYSTAVIPR